MTFTDIDRYKYSVVDVTMTLHSACLGTGDIPPNVEELEAWLKWRVDKGWLPSCISSIKRTDALINTLAFSVLVDCEKAPWKDGRH